MDGKDFLVIKVVLVFGIFGDCRREEITNLMRRDVHDEVDFIKITLPNIKTKIMQEFAVTEGNIQGINCLDLLRNTGACVLVRLSMMVFFVIYRHGKYTQQPVGVNTTGGMSKEIASALGLSEPANYTSHCFWRSSASLLADAGANMHTLKRHGGWEFESVAERYVETSTENKRKIARKILSPSVAVAFTSNATCTEDVVNYKIIATKIMASSIAIGSTSNVTCTEEAAHIFKLGTTPGVKFSKCFKLYNLYQ